MNKTPILSALSAAILLVSSASLCAQERPTEPMPQAQGAPAAPAQQPLPGQDRPAQTQPRQAAPPRAQRPATQGQGTMNAAQVQQMTRDWPEVSRNAIKFVTDKYGPPAAATAEMVLWGETGPWKRTVVYRRDVQHDFPMPHKDVLQQWVAYKAPADRYDELANYDGSVVLERTAGLMSARCDKEGANFLAVNLAHEVATGKRSVEDARMEYGKQIKAMKSGETSEYLSGVMFDQPPVSQTADPGKTLPMMK